MQQVKTPDAAYAGCGYGLEIMGTPASEENTKKK
jgi:hypothetical protein